MKKKPDEPTIGQIGIAFMVLVFCAALLGAVTNDLVRTMVTDYQGLLTGGAAIVAGLIAYDGLLKRIRFDYLLKEAEKEAAALSLAIALRAELIAWRHQAALAHKIYTGHATTSQLPPDTPKTYDKGWHVSHHRLPPTKIYDACADKIGWLPDAVANEVVYAFTIAHSLSDQPPPEKTFRHLVSQAEEIMATEVNTGLIATEKALRLLNSFIDSHGDQPKPPAS